ncbi:hypothetical protein U0C82_03890 [Fulvimarina sp. 2208YS6-2-32]|uniref:Uncharacterized protein n=1 Tax=Fulvimarina uroteuthidis TaxID=3098149 RepID=A0ABU5I2A6_9HYPH|nr:hypothetical protein [Fulvimarina sp. 2208YS6-2-32]MDY8108291.1 hypothetical protein [Fulvimarina sp. 2208YS6-2-32]
MSDIRSVVRDTKRAEGKMSDAVAFEARNMLEELMKREHRGPADTWTAARDRKARKIGLEPSYAKRLWQRWETMTDVSGAAYRAIRNAYELECARMDAIADHYDAATKELLHEVDLESGPRGNEGGRLLDRPDVPSSAAPVRRAGR